MKPEVNIRASYYFPSSLLLIPIHLSFYSGFFVFGPNRSIVLGPKSLLSLVLKPKHHAAAMRVFDNALSPRAMVNLQPTIEGAVAKLVARWHTCAASGEVRKRERESDFVIVVYIVVYSSIYLYVVTVRTSIFAGDQDA